MTTNPLQTPRAKCGAHSRRTGEPCRQSAMANGRCRMHGGKSTGPKNGSRGNWLHGARSRKEIERLKAVRALLAASLKKLSDI